MEESKRKKTDSKPETKKEEKKSEAQLIASMPVSFEGLEDITTLLSQSCDNLKQGELLASSRFQLEKTMSAFEVMDAKMDIRQHARNAMTPKRALKEGVIKHSKDLTLSEVLGILDELMPKFVQWMHGGAVGQTLYTCLYILDHSLYKDNPVLLAYFTAVLHLAYEVQEILRHCTCFREEDYMYSHVLEQLVSDTPQQIEAKFGEAEKYVMGTESAKEMKEGVHARLRMMRGLVALFHKLSGKEAKLDEAQKAIAYAEKQLSAIYNTIALGSPDALKCIDQSVIYSFPIIVHIKKIPEYTKSSAYDKIKHFLKHCKTIPELASVKELQDIWKKLDDFMHDSPSVLARGLFERAILPTAEYFYFGKVPLSDLNIEAIGNYSKSVKTFKTSPVFKDFMEKLSIMTREGFSIHLRNLSRHRRDLEYYFNDLGILLNYAVFLSVNNLLNST